MTDVEKTLAKERSILFDEAEKETIAKVKERLWKENALHTWEACSHEVKLNLVRGYWERSNRVKDIADTCREIYEWRKKNNIDNILEKRMPLHDVYHKAWPSHVGGEDIYGHWFILDRVTELEVSALTKYDEETVLLYRAQCLEALVRMKHEISHRLGYRVCQYIYCLDLSGLSMKKHFTPKVRSILQPLFRVSGDYYPDSLWNLFLINTSVTFRMIWRIISPWVDPVVRQKIKMLAGESSYIPAMEKTGIPIESLPEQMGGKCKTITLKDVVEELIDTPEISDHGFTQNPCPSDPEAVEFHKKQQMELDKYLADEEAKEKGGFAKRLSQVFNRGLRKKTGQTLSVADLKEEGELIYNGDDVLMSGFLSKQGNLNTAWKKRFFVLTENGLYYFSGLPTKESHNPRGKIELHMISACKPHHAHSDGSDGLLDIVTPYRTYAIRVDSTDNDESIAAVTKRWIEAISTAVENDICALDVEAVNDQSSENHQHKGFLEKRGVFNSKWRRRYIVLTTHALYYFNDLPTNVGSSLKGKIDLYNVKACDLDPKQPNEFVVSTARRDYTFKAASKEEAEEWLEFISSAVEKEQQKKAKADASEEDESEDLSAPVQPPMIRSLPEEEDTFGLLGRSTSAMIDQITQMAQDFWDVSMDMGILVKPGDGEDPLPDSDTMAEIIRKRVMHMFKLF